MTYFYSPYFKNYEIVPTYAIVILDEDEDNYNILLVGKDKTVFEQKRDKERILKMIDDEVLIEEDPGTFNLDTVIAKHFLEKDN